MPVWPWSRALVTGASSGIGDAIARALAAQGVHLVVVARSVDRLDALAKELAVAHGVDVEVLAADLAVAEQLAAVEARVSASQDPIDLLVNNAGFGTSGAFVDLDLAEEQREVLVNNLALLRLTHAALKPMTAAGRGAVINVGSIAGFQPTPRNATYGATKAFVVSFSEALHEETRKRGVVVSALCPGFTRTEFQSNADYNTSAIPGFMWGTAEDVAKAGLDAAAKGDALCIPGGINKVAAATTAPLPRFLKRRVAGMIAARGTR